MGDRISNIGTLIDQRARQFPHARMGVVGDERTLQQIHDLAQRGALALLDAGIKSGDCVAVIGHTSTSYIASWMALQLAGIQSAHLNPTYPDDLLREMVEDLGAQAVIWIGRVPLDDVGRSLPHFDLSRLAEKVIFKLPSAPLRMDHIGDKLPGLSVGTGDISIYMHTSGTTGRPKFCALSHESLLRLGRFVADEFGITHFDTVWAPMPMFHLNPMGYGLVGSLVAGAGVLGWGKFSARNFWPVVVKEQFSILILHIPPVQILKTATSAEDALGHKVRLAFCADPEFLETFRIPIGIGTYGSTEGGGLTHTWKLRAGDRLDVPEGMIRYSGRCRFDVAWTLSEDGEILLKEKGGKALLSGYRRNGVLNPPFASDGWLHTGDLGRVDEWGNLIFVDRLSESIRVKGEYVPVEFIESRLRQIPAIGELVLWRRDHPITGHEVLLYTTSLDIPVDAIAVALRDLPAFMRPVSAVVVESFPRDTGVGKVQKRRLAEMEVVATRDLAYS